MLDERRIVQTVEGLRVLCIAEARGALREINTLVDRYNVAAVVHTGSFGFFDGDSSAAMSKDLLVSAATHSPVVPRSAKLGQVSEEHLREAVGSQLSELPLFLARAEHFSVPVYTTWGAIEDVRVLDKFRDGTYRVPNLHILDETASQLVPGTPIRLIGLPGAYIPGHLLDAGDGAGAIAGTIGLTWTSLWQIGELFQTARREYDPNEIRVFLTHTSPALQPLLHYIAIILRADYTLTGGSHYRVPVSYSDSAADSDFGHFEKRLNTAREGLVDFWRQAEPIVREMTADAQKQRELLVSAAELLTAQPRGPALQYMKQAFRNMWHFNLCDLSAGALVLISNRGVLATEMKSTGLDFSLRRAKKVPTEPERQYRDEERRAKRKERADRPERVRRDRDSDGASSNGAKSTSPPPSDTPAAGQGPASQVNATAAAASASVPRPGLWFKNGNRSAEVILGFLAEEDRATNPQVKFKTTTKPDGLKTKVALVFFDSPERASAAYDRVDKDAAGTVSIYQPDQQRPRKLKSKKKW